MGVMLCPNCGAGICDDFDECPYCFSRVYPIENPDIDALISDLVDALAALPQNEMSVAIGHLHQSLKEKCAIEKL